VDDDIALLQLEDASDLDAAPIGDVAEVSVGDAVVAIGNAGGRFGRPSVVGGTVSDTSETITASDADGSDRRTLREMIEVQAEIVSGDSGGAIVDADGEVIGVISAGDSGGRFAFDGSAGGTGYAVPVDRAMDIAELVRDGVERDGVYVGSDRAVLGVAIEDATSGFGRLGGTASGATVLQVERGGAADDAGISAGDTIVSIDGAGTGSSDDLRDALQGHHPGDSVEVGWVDAAGDVREATVELGAGAPA
jgi:S1-C subfamily serine protease